MTELKTKSRETKSLLAKLMASENINVEYREGASTAMFDVESRTLTMPVLKDVTEDSTDLFLGHEVGHALYTPGSAIEEILSKGPVFKGVVNIVEDARIEKMIQSKFPGLRRSFYKGYSDLISSGFFDLKGKDINEMNFIDRINIHFKVGTRAGVVFSEEEMKVVDRIAGLRTFDETLKISNELWDYIKENTPEDDEEDWGEGFPSDNGEEGEEGEGNPGPDMGYGTEDDDTNEADNGETSDEAPEDSNSDEEGESPGGSEEDLDGDGSAPSEESAPEGNEGSRDGGHDPLTDAEEEALKSETMESFEDALRDHLDNSSLPYSYGNVPDMDIEKVLIPMSEVHAELDRAVERHNEDNSESLDAYGSALKGWNKFRSENKSIISYMAKEFEMRKSADEHKRTKVAKTGILNPNKLHAYKFSEDLFLRSNVVSDGKNHGFTMFIDWSGSMGPMMSATIDQLMLLAMFCKKVNIPFDVFAFTTTWFKADLDPEAAEQDNLNRYRLRNRGYYEFDNRAVNDLCVGQDFSLMHLISSTLSTSKFNNSMVYLRWLREGLEYVRWDSERSFAPLTSNLGLGGTPLNEAIIAALKIVPMFRKKNNVQIVNTIFLTDGQGTSSRSTWTHPTPIEGEEPSKELIANHFGSTSGNNIIVDPVTKRHYELLGGRYGHGDTVALLKILIDRTDSRVAGFYIASANKKTFRNEANWIVNGNYEKINDLHDELKKNSFAIVDEDLGYEKFFILSDKYLNVEAPDLEIDEDMTKGRMKNAFVKSRQNKIGNKAMLSKFAEFVS